MTKTIWFWVSSAWGWSSRTHWQMEKDLETKRNNSERLWGGQIETDRVKRKMWELLLLSLSLPLLSVRLGPMNQERSQDRNGLLQSMKGQEGGRWCCDEGEGPVKGILSVSLWTSGDTAMTHNVSNGLWTNTITIKGAGTGEPALYQACTHM